MQYMNEGSSAVYTAQLKDQNGDNVQKAALTEIELTLYAPDHNDDIINSRNDQNVFDANNVTISSTGLLTWRIQPEDNVILDVSKRYERHVALFTFRWGSDNVHHHHVDLSVKNLHKVP